MEERISLRAPVGVPRPQAGWARTLLEGPCRLADRVFGLDGIEALASAVERGDPSVPVMQRVIEATRITARVSPTEFERIPQTGPALLCSNHPLGGADSTALLALAVRRRTDSKILANALMSRFPFLAPHCIFVDPFGGAEAARRNALAVREALAWIKAGHLLVAFPAGEVSAVRWGGWNPCDAPWSTIPARLALSARAKVVPVWCEGTNGNLFHAAGLIHPRLRTALLPNEYVARCGTEVEFAIGRAMSAETLGLDAEELTRLVRGRSELLRRHPRVARRSAELAPIPAARATAAELAADFAALPAECRLLTEGGYSVFAARAAQLPKAMTEIGRLREIAFRAVGEGSGNDIDVDRFDASYVQLVIWNEAKQEIVGGYRVGAVADVTRDVGVEGLYTSTLFEYSPRMIAELGDAVELGRSFVRPEYQKQVLPLSLLWKGIGIYMFTNGYRRMFGPVSISNDYNSMSKELIMEFLERHRLSAPFAKLVTPRNPPARRGVSSWTEREKSVAIGDLQHVDRLVEEIERGQRAVPVLLRQYLRLNARLLAFNVDADFGEVVDALMLVDITQIDDRIVQHYIGDEGPAMIRARFGLG